MMSPPALARPVRGPRVWQRQRHAAPYTFLIPALILFTLFVFIPMGYALWISLQKWNILGKPSWVGLRNYETLFADPVFRQSIWHTLAYTLGTVPVGIVLSLVVAIWLNQPIRLRNFFRSVIFLPVVTSMVAVGLLWRYMFATEYGVVNYLLNLVGVHSINWLASSPWAMISVVIATIWRHLGYNMVIILAGLQGIPVQVYEAAAMDGADGWKRFSRITLPLLRPTLLFATVISVINSFRAFEQIYVMTGGGPGYDTTVLVVYLYREAFQMFHMGTASGAAYILFVILMVLTMLQMKYFGQEVEY